MGDVLALAGHTVIWWTSNFSHHFKSFRSQDWKDIEVQERFKIRLVPTPGYQKNISLLRVIRDIYFAQRAFLFGKKILAPDCIISAEPPLFSGTASQKLANYHRCPIIFDQMDLWPELFESIFGSVCRPLIHILLYPIYLHRKKFYNKCEGIIALAQPNLDLALREAPRLKDCPHEIVYNGIDVQAFRAQMQLPLPKSIQLTQKRNNEIWAVFAGSLGPTYDIATMLKAASWCERRKLPIRFIIAGDGPLKGIVESSILTKPHGLVSYIGKLSPLHLPRLYEMCDIGLSTYTWRSNVEMPDKFYDYTAAGLAIINSLRGEVREIIENKRLGLQYIPNDPISLGLAIEKLCADHELLKEIRRNSFSAAIVFDRKNQYARVVHLVNQVCKLYAD
jgi:glycosyltransferase involved in cell wall biosynthesis